MNRPLYGIVPPLITPLLAPDRLDLDSLHRLVESLVAADVGGLFILGSTGEAQNLSMDLRRQVVSAACGALKGRKPLLVGISDCCCQDAAALAHHAAAYGADAVVFTPPYYFQLTQAEVLRYSLRLAEMLQLPYFLYNIPAQTRNSFEVDTVEAISRHPLCAGVKDSSGNWEYFRALVARFRSRPDFTVLMGLEEYIESGVAAGAHGAVSGGANLCPELYVSCYRAAVEGRTEEARALQSRINAIVTGIYGMTPGIGGYLRGLKCAMELRGLCSGAMSDSFEPYAGADRYRVGEVLARLGLL